MGHRGGTRAHRQERWHSRAYEYLWRKGLGVRAKGPGCEFCRYHLLGDSEQVDVRL